MFIPLVIIYLGTVGSLEGFPVGVLVRDCWRRGRSVVILRHLKNIIKCQIWMKILIQFTFHLLINRFYTFGLIHWGLTGKSTFNAHNSNCPDHMYKHAYAFYSENLTLIFWTVRGLTQYIQDAYLFLEPVDGPLPLGWDLHQVVLHWSTLTGQADQELDTSVGSPAVCGMIQSHGGWSKPWNSAQILKY